MLLSGIVSFEFVVILVERQLWLWLAGCGVREREQELAHIYVIYATARR